MDTFDQQTIAPMIGQEIVLDTQGPLVYIGTLSEIRPGLLVLLEADVHDRNDSPTTKELYLQETRELGVRVNRARVLVMREEIASISLLKDIRD